MRIDGLSSHKLFLCLILALSLALPSSAAATDDTPLRMMAFAGNQDGGETTLLDITISRWTPEGERRTLLASVYSADGPSLREALQRSDPKGRVAPRAELGISLRYAYRVEREHGSTIILAADRPIEVDEAIDQGVVSRAYDTTVIILELDESGRGQGTLIAGAEVQLGAEGRLEFTNVVPNPVLLTGVRVTSGR